MPHLPFSLRNLIRILGLLMVAALIATAAFLVYLADARNTPFQLTDPTGAYPVGRVEYVWTDLSRTDPLADQGSAKRELVIWVWYPAATKGTSTAPYLPPAWAQSRDRDQGIGVLVEHNFTRIGTHSFEGVPLAASPEDFPVLIMEPGMGPMATDYTTLAENLASHGYIVIGINPTYTSNWTVFPDGQVVMRSTKGTIPDSDTPDEANADASRILAVWVQDVQFVLDRLATVNADQSSMFRNRLDLDHIGVWGHSFGGATALAVCQTDSRCKAGVDIDGTPFGAERQGLTPRPFMFLTEDYREACDENCSLMRQAYENAQSGSAYFLSVSGAQHFNFSDLPYRQQPVLRPLFTLVGLDGTIDPARGLQITNAYLAAFFDMYLKGKQDPLLTGPSAKYPEVTFERH